MKVGDTNVGAISDGDRGIAVRDGSYTLYDGSSTHLFNSPVAP
jgi:hypothetical protein